MNINDIDQLLERNPKLAIFRHKLEAMQPGTYCMHQSWGFGKIVRYESAHQRLIIDFECDRQGHSMDPVLCVDKLELLQENSLIVRKHLEPSYIENLIKKEPVELVILSLQSFDNQMASSLDLERALTRLMGAMRFKKWWVNAKKLVEQDPRLASPIRKTDAYILRDEPVQQEFEALESYHAARNVREKIARAEKLLDFSEHLPQMQKEVHAVWENLTQMLAAAKQLNPAERLQGMWICEDLGKYAGAEGIKNPLLDPTQFLQSSKNQLVGIVEGLHALHYKRFLEGLKHAFDKEWVRNVLELFRISSGKFTQECAQFLVDQEEELALKNSLLQWLNEQNLRGPVIMWVFKNRQHKRFSPLFESILNTRLLGAALYAIDLEALQLTTNRRIPLAEYLSEDLDLIPDLLKDASEETAHDLANALILSQGFEELAKKSLLARFIKRFESIQSLLTGDTPKDSERTVVSQASFDARKKEYDHLVSVKIPENKEAIVVAREHGDLRENSEYKMARQDQEVLMARKALLEAELAKAIVTDFSEAQEGIVSIGSVVDLIEGSTGKKHCFTILGAWDSDPEKSILSYKTPLARSLLGKKSGESVVLDINGRQETWSVEGVRRWMSV
jgi:transcription elongation GreA/GreB family factor